MIGNITRLALAAMAVLLLASCAGESFKPCEVSVMGVRPAKGSSKRMLGALLGQLAGGAQAEAAAPEFVVTLKVGNPNGRGVDVRGLSGTVSGPEGELGTFRLPPESVVPLPAKGSAVVDILAQPGPGFLRQALPLLLSRAGRADIRATGHIDVDTWLGVRRIDFKDVRIAGGEGNAAGDAADSPPREPSAPLRP